MSLSPTELHAQLGWHQRLTIATFRGPAQPVAIPPMNQIFKRARLTMPDEYAHMMTIATEIEFYVDGDRYWRLWDPQGVVELNEAYDYQSKVRAVAIGDDGGSGILSYQFLGGDAQIARASWSDQDPDASIFLSPSINLLLRLGIGLDEMIPY